MAKRLILNADDLGYTRGVNRAIVECFAARALTSSTLMANGEALNDAVAARGELPVGCHIVLIDGTPVSGEALPTLAPGGQFRDGMAGFAATALRGGVSGGEVEREVAAQIERVQSTGIAPTHVDAHKHAHVFPSILRPLLKAAKRCGVPAVRNPFEPSWSLPLSAKLRGGRSLRTMQVAMLRRAYARSFAEHVRESGMRTTDGALGVIATGTLDAQTICQMLERTPEGTWELVCHPGYDDAELRAASTRLTSAREVERQALMSEKVRECIAREGIECISFAEI